MEVYKSKYYVLNFFAETALLETIAFPETEIMTPEEFKQECLQHTQIMVKFRPKKNLYDTRNMLFPIVPELQEWLNQTIFPILLDIELNISALIVSQEVIAQLSIEQTMEESESSKITSRYFSNKEEAKEWILSLP